MIRSRQFAALLGGLAVLYLSIGAASSFARVTCGARGASERPAAGAVQAMPVRGMPSGTSSSAVTQAPSSDQAPCETPWMSAGCLSFIACGATALAPSRERASAVGVAPTELAALIVITPTSRTIPPELPPPRA